MYNDNAAATPNGAIVPSAQAHNTEAYIREMLAELAILARLANGLQALLANNGGR